jgi:hypothetical protein
MSPYRSIGSGATAPDGARVISRTHAKPLIAWDHERSRYTARLGTHLTVSRWLIQGIVTTKYNTRRAPLIDAFEDACSSSGSMSVPPPAWDACRDLFPRISRSESTCNGQSA